MGRPENVEMGKEFVKAFGKMMNGSCSGNKDLIGALVKQFRCEHNTLQQLMLGVLRDCIIGIADSYPDNWMTDARNEASIKWVKDVADISRDRHFPFI